MRWLFAHPVKADHDRLVAAIEAAEKRTSGRIHVLVARHRARDPMAAAKRHFRRMGLARTEHRNGVLIFVAPRSRNFAVIGDEGVHRKCGEDFWSDVVAAMAGHFGKGDFTAGLVHGIERAGGLLAEHFPADPGPPETHGDVEEVD